MHDPDTFGAVITTAATHNLWPEALPLVSLLPGSTHPTLAANLAALSDSDFHAATQAAPAAGATATLVQVILHQDTAGRARSLSLLDQAPDLEALVDSLTTTNPTVWERLSEIRAEIPERLRTVLAAQAIRCGHTLGSSGSC
ncbi:hypothetical protein [Nocardia sp. NPDC060259]|uniref:hypothetical protein n=1 Tax=Nocardia sp. NPDC060259 TaxID=3347088 RepID=UPI003665A256